MAGFTKVRVAFGDGYMQFPVRKASLLGVVESRVRARGKAPGLLSRALRSPSGGLSLKDALKDRSSILVAVTDSTRKSHLRTVLPRILDELRSGSNRADIIVATGLHNVLNAGEKAALVGRTVMARYNVLDHDAGPGGVVDLGRTSLGAPITLDRKIFDHDAVVTVGTVEPHLYAGYSGGAKTVAIGLAGRGTIDYTHGIRYLADPATKIGSIDGNPFQDTLWEIAGRAPVAYSVNIVNDQRGRPLRIFAGEPRAVFRDAVACARKVYEAAVDGRADIVVAGIGYPKDINLYQASRAINYITNVDSPIVGKGGILIVCAALKDGIGTSSAEATFHAMLRKMRSPGRLIEDIAKSGCVAGEHRAYMVARSLVDYRVAFVSPGMKSVFDGLPFGHFEDIGAALSWSMEETGPSASIHVVPHALTTVANSDEN